METTCVKCGRPGVAAWDDTPPELFIHHRDFRVTSHPFDPLEIPPEPGTSQIGLPDGLSADDAYVAGLADGRSQMRGEIKARLGPEGTADEAAPLDVQGVWRERQRIRTIIDEMDEGDRRPLVIVGIGGGLVQWDIVKRGVGTPRVHYLDFDREGEPPEETEEFVGRYQEARDALAEFGDPADAAALANMDESIADYRRMIADGESPGRYR